MSDRTDTIKPARIDLGDGDSLNLYRMSDYTTVVRFHGNNPNVQLSSAQVSTVALRAALDKVAPGSNSPIASPDYADGGVTAAAIEKEAERFELADDPDYWHAKFCEARQERDELRQTRRRLLGKVDQLEVKLRDIEGPEPRPLTAREHLQLAWDAAHVPVDGIIPAGAAYLMRANRTGRVVTPTGDWAAPVDLPASESWGERRLLDPPTPSRPDGAEEIEAYMREMVASHPEDHYGELADHLASRGVRVVTEEEGRHATDE